jgi:hypothetical protein
MKGNEGREETLNQAFSFSRCRFFNSLSLENKKKVAFFCDIDPNKLGKKYNNLENPEIRMYFYNCFLFHSHSLFSHFATVSSARPVIHWQQARAPLVICVALDRTNGQLESNIASLKIKQGVDYWCFV